MVMGDEQMKAANWTSEEVWRLAKQLDCHPAWDTVNASVSYGELVLALEAFAGRLAKEEADAAEEPKIRAWVESTMLDIAREERWARWRMRAWLAIFGAVVWGVGFAMGVGAGGP